MTTANCQKKREMYVFLTLSAGPTTMTDVYFTQRQGTHLQRPHASKTRLFAFPA